MIKYVYYIKRFYIYKSLIIPDRIINLRNI